MEWGFLKLLKPLEVLYPKQSHRHLGQKEVYCSQVFVNQVSGVHFPDQMV